MAIVHLVVLLKMLCCSAVIGLRHLVLQLLRCVLKLHPACAVKLRVLLVLRMRMLRAVVLGLCVYLLVLSTSLVVRELLLMLRAGPATEVRHWTAAIAGVIRRGHPTLVVRVVASGARWCVICVRGVVRPRVLSLRGREVVLRRTVDLVDRSARIPILTAAVLHVVVLLVQLVMLMVVVLLTHARRVGRGPRLVVWLRLPSCDLRGAIGAPERRVRLVQVVLMWPAAAGRRWHERAHMMVRRSRAPAVAQVLVVVRLILQVRVVHGMGIHRRPLVVSSSPSPAGAAALNTSSA
mmetsp:Transcript_28257/g.71718  ORF Transcript_28257/g.71718 Transcript_28257/m.71718 type:complete len:293 (-) Transcript_28257:1649-2527(-)